MATLTADDYEALVNESLDALPAEYVANVLETVDLHVARYYGKPLTQQGFTEQLEGQIHAYGGQALLRVVVTYTPLVSVDSVSVYYALGTDPQPLDITNARTDARTGEILIPFGMFGTWRSLFHAGGRYYVDVTYTAGEGATVPVDVKRALALLVQEQLAADAEVSRESTDDVTSFTIGEYSETRQTFAERASWRSLGLGTRNSRIAKDILDRYYGTAGAVLI